MLGEREPANNTTPLPRGRGARYCGGRSGGLDPELARGDLVPEAVRIQAVLARLTRLRLRVHEEGHRVVPRAEQLDVVRVVVGEPVHLPLAEELRARLLRRRVVERDAAPLLQHDLADVGRVHRHPAVAGGVKLGPAVLRPWDLAGLTQALELRGVRRAHAVDVAGPDARRAREPHDERTEVRALAAQVAGLEHGPDIAQ